MTAPADPELLLAAACCRWPPSEARDATVRQAAAGIDWTRFGHVVARHRIAGLVDPALRAARVDPPAAVASAIGQAARRIVHDNLLATGETTRVVRLIADASYPVLAVKGVVLGMQAYGSVAFKHSKDIDLLILPEHREAVLELLERDTYRLVAPAPRLSAEQRAVLARYGKDVSLAHRALPRVQIELHWRLFDNAAVLPALTATSSSERVMLGSGLEAPTLAPSALYAYLVRHGAGDGWSRMKSIADLHALIAPLGAEELRARHDDAVVLGAGVASAQALLLMHELFGLPLAADFAAALRRSRRVRWLVAGAYRLMAPHDGKREIADWWGGQMRALAMQLLLGRGLRYFWQIARAVLYMPADMYRSRIPPALYGFYPLVRIPAWLLRRPRMLAASATARANAAAAGSRPA